MNVLYFLVPIALALAGMGIVAFRWAVNSGQFDDLDSPQFRMLIDEEVNQQFRRTNENKAADSARDSQSRQRDRSRINN